MHSNPVFLVAVRGWGGGMGDVGSWSDATLDQLEKALFGSGYES